MEWDHDYLANGFTFFFSVSPSDTGLTLVLRILHSCTFAGILGGTGMR